MQKFIRISRVARATKSDKTKRTIFLRIFPSWENEKDITFSTKITVSKHISAVYKPSRTSREKGIQSRIRI
jgi:hypothetical protein